MIALAQVTFGIAWAGIFLPIDYYKGLVIVSNTMVTGLLLIGGNLLKERK
jgi:hypothetical protein